MATTSTTSLTFKRSVILKKLETRVNEMKKEIDAWVKENDSLSDRQKAWDKKARAWFKKNAASLINDNTSVYHNSHYHNNNSFRFTVEASPDKVIAAIGEYPEQDCRPAWDRAEYRGVSPIEELEANIAAFKAAEEDEIKVSIKNNIFRYIK
jgi:hypothetical protein